MSAETDRLEELVDTYAGAWSDPDPGVRRQYLETCVTEDVSYTDPSAHVRGRVALAVHLDELLARMPGARIERTSGVDAYGGVARFGWHLVGADGAEVLLGLDFIELADDGRIARITGFFGPLT